eukprot:PhM_4_TR5361/c0_g2_i1/m.29100
MPLRPSCTLCCSDCDANALFTSCQHFLCSKCASKAPAGQCPRCNKSCQVVRLGAPNFPKEVRDRIMGDPLKMMQQTMQVMDFQRRQDADAVQRLKELITHFNTNLRNMAQQLEASKKENARLRSEVENLKSQVEQGQVWSNMELTRSPASMAFCNNDNNKRTRSVSHQPEPSKRRPRSPLQLAEYNTAQGLSMGGGGGGGGVTPANIGGGFVLGTPAVALPSTRDTHSSHSARTLPGLLPNRGQFVHSSSGQSEPFVPPRMFTM